MISVQLVKKKYHGSYTELLTWFITLEMVCGQIYYIFKIAAGKVTNNLFYSCCVSHLFVMHCLHYGSELHT